MNAHRDRELLACSFVQDCAALGLNIATHLLAAATAGDVAGVEARLWQWRRVLSEAVKAWREAVPPLSHTETGVDE